MKTRFCEHIIVIVVFVLTIILKSKCIIITNVAMIASRYIYFCKTISQYDIEVLLKYIHQLIHINEVLTSAFFVMGLCDDLYYLNKFYYFLGIFPFSRE